MLRFACGDGTGTGPERSTKPRARDASACQHRPRTPGAVRRGAERAAGGEDRIGRGTRNVPGESPGDCLGRATWWVRPWSCACSGCVRCDRRERRGGRSRCPRRGSGRRRRGSCAGEWWPVGAIGRDSSVRRDWGSDRRVARRLRARDARAPETRHETFVPISRHRRANFTRREDVPARRRWFPSHLGFPRARPTGQPSRLTAFVRVSRRKRSSRARNASRRRRRAQPRRGRRRFSRSCCETPAFGRHDGFQKTAARRALFSRFALCHITARFSLISTITMNKHPSTGCP